MVRSQCICGVSPYPWYSRTNRHQRLKRIENEDYQS